MMWRADVAVPTAFRGMEFFSESLQKQSIQNSTTVLSQNSSYCSTISYAGRLGLVQEQKSVFRPCPDSECCSILARNLINHVPHSHSQISLAGDRLFLGRR